MCCVYPGCIWQNVLWIRGILLTALRGTITHSYICRMLEARCWTCLQLLKSQASALPASALQFWSFRGAAATALQAGRQPRRLSTRSSQRWVVSLSSFLNANARV